MRRKAASTRGYRENEQIMTMKCDLRLLISATLALCVAASSAQSTPLLGVLQQRLEQMQQAASWNAQQLHTYQWIEATTLTVNGTQAPPKQSICRYAADGILLKTPLGTPEQQVAPERHGGAIKRHIAKEMEEKVQGEVEQIQALTQLYLPFNPGRFREVLGTGRVGLERDGVNGDAIILNNYAKAGDLLKLTVDPANMQIVRISVKSYFEEPMDEMNVDIHFSRLADGTIYPALTSIEAPAKKLSITTVDSDFSKAVY